MHLLGCPSTAEQLEYPCRILIEKGPTFLETVCAIQFVPCSIEFTSQASCFLVFLQEHLSFIFRQQSSNHFAIDTGKAVCFTIACFELSVFVMFKIPFGLLVFLECLYFVTWKVFRDCYFFPSLFHLNVHPINRLCRFGDCPSIFYFLLLTHCCLFLIFLSG